MAEMSFPFVMEPGGARTAQLGVMGRAGGSGFASPADLLPIQLLLTSIDSPRPRVTGVVLASAHLNHDPGDNRPRKLAALCQRCHMIHDAAEHRPRRWMNRFQLKALRDLLA